MDRGESRLLKGQIWSRGSIFYVAPYHPVQVWSQGQTLKSPVQAFASF